MPSLLLPALPGSNLRVLLIVVFTKFWLTEFIFGLVSKSRIVWFQIYRMKHCIILSVGNEASKLNVWFLEHHLLALALREFWAS